MHPGLGSEPDPPKSLENSEGRQELKEEDMQMKKEVSKKD